VAIVIEDWWVNADLWMQSIAQDGTPIEVASGPLAEIVGLARSANRAEQDLLFITSPSLDGALAPCQVQMLVARPDLPVVI
jgi:hypothetical protein